jgi:hypothetical protein
MQEIGQRHAPAASRRGKGLRFPLDSRLGGPQSRSARSGEEKNPRSCFITYSEEFGRKWTCKLLPKFLVRSTSCVFDSRHVITDNSYTIHIRTQLVASMDTSCGQISGSVVCSTVAEHVYLMLCLFRILK